MNSIDLPANFNGVIKTLTIAQPEGSGDSYQIMIDRYYQGTIVRYKGNWVGHLNDRSTLTQKNIQTIGKIIENKFGSKT